MTLIFYAVLLARKLPKHSAKWTSPRPDPRPLCPPVKCCHLRAEPRRRRPDPPAPGPPSRRPRRRVCEGGQSLVRGEDAASGGERLVQFWLWGERRWCEGAGTERNGAHNSDRPGFQTARCDPGPCFPAQSHPRTGSLPLVFTDRRVGRALAPWGAGAGGRATFAASLVTTRGSILAASKRHCTRNGKCSPSKNVLLI